MPLGKDVGAWIKDFMKSNAPQFKGKSKEERKNMALAAYRAEYGSMNEVSGNIDTKDFVQVIQALGKTTHPVTVMLAPSFGKNEIEIITGMNAPDTMIRDISNIMDDLGYKSGKDYIMSGDSSTLSREEYTEMNKVNGGHRDYYKESVNEEEDLSLIHI